MRWFDIGCPEWRSAADVSGRRCTPFVCANTRTAYYLSLDIPERWNSLAWLD